MAPKTGMTGRLLLLMATAYALLSLISLTGSILEAREVRDGAELQVKELRESIASLEGEEKDAAQAAREELKMIRAGEKLLLFGR